MLTKYDEFLCHQTIDTFNTVSTSAREWTERIWFSAHDTAGKYHIVAGIGMYPNRNIMDAFISVVVNHTTQHNIRASRVLRPDIDSVFAGPIKYEIVDPGNKVRFILSDNDSGISSHITFTASMTAHIEGRQYTQLRGRTLEEVTRYVQTGHPEGWIIIDGEKITISADSWCAERDHSWGIRRGGGVPETGVQPGEIPTGYLFNFILTQFDNWGAAYHIRENWDEQRLFFDGSIYYPIDNDRASEALTAVEHNFSFKQDMRQISGGEAILHAQSGEKKLQFRPLSVCYLKGGGYFGYRGFTHGLWLGESYLDYVKTDLTDPDQLREISFLDDVMCEVSCDGEIGYGIVEMVVIGKYPRYGYEGF